MRFECHWFTTQQTDMTFLKDATNATPLSENGFQIYLNNHRHMMTLLKDDCDGGIDWVWPLLGDCLVRTEHVIGFYCGLLAIPLWCSSHIMLCLMSVKSASPRRTFQITCLPHLAADLFNLFGALLSYQFSSQILFALCALLVNILICLHHLSIKSEVRSVQSTYEESQRNVNGKVVEMTRQRGQQFLMKHPKICAVVFLVFFVTADVAKTWIQVLTRRMNTNTHTGYHCSTLEITGMALGAVSSVLYCLTSLANLTDSIGHVTFGVFAAILTILADSLYLFGVYTQGMTSSAAVHTLPWSTGRAGLLGINTGAILQYVLIKWRRKAEVETREEQHSLLSSTSRESCEGNGEREDTLQAENTPSMPAAQNDNHVEKVDEMKKPETVINVNHYHVTSTRQRNNSKRQMTGCYSSETSVTITNDADIESDLNCQAHVYENWRALMMSERRSSFTLKLSQLETETCHDRVIQWFEKSTPEDEAPFSFELKG